MTDPIAPALYTGGRTPEQADALVNHIMTGVWTMAIEPALSDSEWVKQLNDRGGLEIQAFPKECSISIQDWGAMSGVTVRADDLPALIALANAALPDSDRRKLRHHWISWLREEAEILNRNGAGAGALIAAEIADVLESYLSPTNV
jgi:hypothetical protein